MKKKGYETTTYEAGEALIDIVETAETYEAWIYKENNGEKMIMFSCAKEQQPKSEFIEMAEGNIDEYLAEYERENEACELFFDAAAVLKVLK